MMPIMIIIIIRSQYHYYFFLVRSNYLAINLKKTECATGATTKDN